MGCKKKVEYTLHSILAFLICPILSGCDRYDYALSNIEAAIAASQDAIRPAPPQDAQIEVADVLAVEAAKTGEAYNFRVTIASPDLGCDQYADWWEVLGEDGALLYRRVLLHSHASEQPFTRSGGPVAISADQILWIRAHMHPGGYGGTAFRGSVQEGFQPTGLSPSFAAAAEEQLPLPEDCDF